VIFVDLVAAVALFQFSMFIVMVGRARHKYDVKAPAVVGHEMFERIYRVQMNTLESLIIFIPALYLAAKYWAPVSIAAIGAVFIVGRVIYAIAYLKDPKGRSFGYVLSLVPMLTLVFAAIAGLLYAMHQAQ